jgi:signal transduction histidine kinase
MLMSLFVLPIAVVGLKILPPSSNPDLFVLTLPLSQGQDGLATLSFLGGCSSATSRVIVATIALATMVSNHIVAPIWLNAGGGEGATRSGDVRRVIVIARRVTIAAILALGYLYYRLSGGGAALAAIGLVSFSGSVQVLPVMIGGVFWRGATRIGAALGLMTGFGVWLWTLFLPSLGVDAVLTMSIMEQGPFGIEWLRPQGLFGITGLDPLVHGLFWSILLNSAMLFIGSVLRFPQPLERLQGAQFVDVYAHSTPSRTWTRSAADAEDLLIMSQRILGSTQAQAHFQAEAVAQGKDGYLPDVTPDFVASLERELAGSVGAAAAHAMIGQLTQGSNVSVEDLIAVADEAAQIMEYSNRLEAKSAEQEITARALREANEKLTTLSVQKDAFLSQISHELRTPMTSIRSFSEILRDMDMSPKDRGKYAGIINEEALRLTRLLDDLLDLAVLESGQVSLHQSPGVLAEVIDRAIDAAGVPRSAIKIGRRRGSEVITLKSDLDRLEQVFINLISNAAKYCDADKPILNISVIELTDKLLVDFVDNGSGIPREKQTVIFEKFSRLTDQSKSGGAGLGLAICREIMHRLGGDISYLPGQGGTAFRVTLPREKAHVEQ